MAGWRCRPAAVAGLAAPVRRLAVGVVLAAALALLPACVVQRAARGVAGVDLSAIRAGATRAGIEAQLGPPLRQWTTAAGVVYRIYRYDPGVPGSKSGATALVFGEIATLGLLEVIMKSDPATQQTPPSLWRKLAVAYGADEVVLGVFVDVDDFVVLPDDGLPRLPALPAGTRP